MAKRATKRQKTKSERGHAGAVQPAALGSRTNALEDEDAKDDEERRLESLLFGTPFVASDKKKGKEKALVLTMSDDEGGGGAGKEFENLLDSDLFFFDETAPTALASASALDEPLEGEGEGSSPSSSSASDSDDRSTESDSESDEDTDEQHSSHASPSAHVSATSPARKAPAWTDPDDPTLEVSLASSARLRKLRDAPSDDTVGGREYERRLRRQFERINPAPEWATRARSAKKGKRRREDLSDHTEEEDVSGPEDVDALLASTGGILGQRKTKALEQGMISIERLRDVNLAAKAEGEVKCIRFHPSPAVPVLCVASGDRRVRLFNVDGHTNPHLQTLHLPSLPLTNASFHPAGTSLLFTGPRPFYFTYDLHSGTTQRSPRGLWGTTFGSAQDGASPQDASMEISAFSPDGSVLAVAGRRGYIHLVDWTSGAGQVVGSVKMNAAVKSLWWVRGAGGGAGGRELMALGDDGEVYMWDVGERRCVRRWKDDGAYGGRILEGDRGGGYLAIGSTTGFVNVYGSDAASSTSYDAPRPKPLKAIGNLTTAITSMRFNHDAQLLAIASDDKKDQMRLVHVPSLTVFANWPTSGTPLGHVNTVDFSAGSEYVAMGNNRGRVLLYHLKDFGAR